MARISKGRTIREVINAALIAPSVTCFLWFTVFGGAGLQTERTAAAAINSTHLYCCLPEPEELSWVTSKPDDETEWRSEVSGTGP